jgi:tetratricopeptide (TPR) repeat protein
LAPNFDYAAVRFRVGKSLLVAPLIGVAITLPASSSAQEQTLARLNHEAAVTLPHASISTTSKTPQYSHPARLSALPDSALARSAANALFVDSDLNRAGRLAEQVLRHSPKNAEALFVRMEVAAMQADTATMLDAAIRLCEVGEQSPSDLRVRLAGARIREAAENTPEFRAAVPRVKALLANSQQPWSDLHAALLSAAMDGEPNLDPYAISRSTGILTDWRIVGPLSHKALDLDDSISSSDDLSRPAYFNRSVENFQFPDGRIVLPDYLSHHGTFYAAGRFSSLTTSQWLLSVESGNAVEVYVDGQRITRTSRESTFEVTPGPHRVLVKFGRAAAPLRITIRPAVVQARTPLPAKISLQEATYLLAAEHYVSGDHEAAAKQISAVSSADSSAPLQFLLAESTQQESPTSAHATVATAGSAGEEVWERRIADHPSCKNLRGALDFYRAKGDLARAEATLHKLDGCGPESLDYAQALSAEGNHTEAARALRQLTAAAPLNRAARSMLVRELQLAGEDKDAQQGAAEWLHIAPNAENYHRLATASTADAEADGATTAFYAAYRRDAEAIAHEASDVATSSDLTLLEDHVAIARPDGSVSLYVHDVKRFATETGARASIVSLPYGAEVLNNRILLSNGSASIVDQEYLLHYAGDGGIPEHPEVFQFVFGNFGSRVLHSRFVVLTPAERADRGTVIASGDAPMMSSAVINGLLQRMWSQDESTGKGTASAVLSFSAPPIIRIVEQENGWTVPSNAEHQRRIETIHPGPRPEDS